MMPTSLEELRQWLVTELPKWLKEHPELRDTLESVLAETFVRRDEWHKVAEAPERLAEGKQSLQRSTEELQRTTRELQQTLQQVLSQQAEHNRILREHNEWLKELRKGQQRHDQLLEEHGRAIWQLEARIGALGRRRGMESEVTFCEAMYRLLSPLGYAVERFLIRGDEGVVFGRPDQIEIDLLIRDDEVIAAEIRASVSKSDVAVFLRKLEFAQRFINRTITRRVIISPFVDDDALRFAQEAGIGVYELPDDMQSR